MGLEPWATSSSQLFALVTGANSGLGFSICQRLVDEFLSSPSRDPSSHLVLIVTTRSPLKTRYTITRLRHHLRHLVEHSGFSKGLRKRAARLGEKYDWRELAARVHFLGVELDLCDLRQVYAAARKIRGLDGGLGSPDAVTSEGLRRVDGKGVGLKGVRIPRLDALILNAGIGGWSGLNWPLAIWLVLTNTIEAVTWPVYKIARVGATIKQRTLKDSSDGGDVDSVQQLLHGDGHIDGHKGKGEPVLGEVFCANLFGHYVLGHQLMPLLSSMDGRAEGERGRIIWLSSIEAQGDSFDEDDFQGLKSLVPYESSKRLTDILALTVDLPSVLKSSASYFEVGEEYTQGKEIPKERPVVYVAHPGICATEIVPLYLVLQWAMMGAFYFARLLGSVWHCVHSYTGATAPVWLALSEQRILDSMERRDEANSTGNGKGKWGSSTDLWGESRVRRTEVGGWGWNGAVEGVGAQEKRGRKRNAVDLTRERREEFEALGARCWREIERMRRDWEQYLGLGGEGP